MPESGLRVRMQLRLDKNPDPTILENKEIKKGYVYTYIYLYDLDSYPALSRKI